MDTARRVVASLRKSAHSNRQTRGVQLIISDRQGRLAWVDERWPVHVVR